MSKFTEFAQAVGEDFKSVNELAMDNLDAIAKIKTQLLGLPKDSSGGTVFVPSINDLTKLEKDINGRLDNPNAGERRISPISYWYPDYHKADSKWNQAVTIDDNIGFVIINIDSGRGTVQPEHIEQAKRAKAVGASVLIYLPTGYGNFDKVDLLKRYQKYKADMSDLIDGIFFDETINGFSEQASLIPKYKELYKTIKQSGGGGTTIVANPGSNVAEELLDSADVFMNFESSADKYLERDITPDYCKRENSTKFWHCIYNVTKDNYRAVLEKADKEHVGHLYLVDNPSYGSPASPWLQDAMRDWANKNISLAKRVEELKTSSLTVSQAYGLFPTYNNFFQQVMEQNKFAEDPIATKSQLPTSEIDALKQKVAELEKMLLEIKQK